MQDLDDWDLEDKSFCWADDVVESTNPLFQLNKDSGMITMQAGKIKPGVYDLSFLVDDRKHGQTAIPAYVTVNVIELPQNFHSFAASLRIRYKLINFYIYFFNLLHCIPPLVSVNCSIEYYEKNIRTPGKHDFDKKASLQIFFLPSIVVPRKVNLYIFCLAF